MIRLYSRLRYLLIFVLCMMAAPAFSAPKILVLHPDLTAVYGRVFEEILSGIESTPGVEISTRVVTEQTSLAEITTLIQQRRFDGVIALGQSSHELGYLLKDQLSVVHGGLFLNPNGHSGISLAGSPHQFYAALNVVAPQVKRVLTVYNEKNSGWLIDVARKEAAASGIILEALAASDVREAAQQFQVILDRARGPQDAIWLLLDNVIPDKTVLPVILDVAWRKKVVLFSNNPLHSKRGALFALFPDHPRLGANLMEMVLKQIRSDHQPTVIPLSRLKVSVNERTATHLGLNYSIERLNQFDLVYSQQ
ncbi:MAG: hypothetical protein HY272_11115 [Gammaproteobacteria bacterium]|nr:hypothetical protein [Gammaproteobacteria bacterium]